MAKSPRTRTRKIAPPAGYKYKSIDSFCRRTATASQAITPITTTHDQVSQPLDKECSFDNRVTRAERRLMEENKSKHWLNWSTNCGDIPKKPHLVQDLHTVNKLCKYYCCTTKIKKPSSELLYY